MNKRFIQTRYIPYEVEFVACSELVIPIQVQTNPNVEILRLNKKNY